MPTSLVRVTKRLTNTSRTFERSNLSSRTWHNVEIHGFAHRIASVFADLSVRSSGWTLSRRGGRDEDFGEGRQVRGTCTEHINRQSSVHCVYSSAGGTSVEYRSWQSVSSTSVRSLVDVMEHERKELEFSDCGITENTEQTNHPWNALTTITTFDQGIHIYIYIYA